MTFTEAAVEVLRSVGKPLHYKKITELAIERNLLSHVGKTPETTMSSRLATMVKKDRGDAPITKVKPGVFALREFSEGSVEVPESASAESDAPEASAADAAPEEAVASEETAEAGPEAEADTSIAAQDLPGADVFPEEDGDDDLILANLDDDSREDKRPRKRRPRRRRERDSEGGSSTDSRADSRADSRSDSRSERRPAPRSRTRKEPPAPATRAAEAGEPVGRDLSDAIETALRGRSHQPRALSQIAEALIGTGRLAGTPALLAPTLAAAIRGDNAKRRASGGRPRFREGDGLVSLMEWSLPSDAVNAERDAIRAADRQRQSVRRAFIKRLHDLPDGALLELLATWLNAVGVQSLRGVRVVALRGGLHHFDHARMGWVVTLGQVSDGTASEAHAEGAAPCALFDGDALATSMEEVGVGIQRASLPLAASMKTTNPRAASAAGAVAGAAGAVAATRRAKRAVRSNRSNRVRWLAPPKATTASPRKSKPARNPLAKPPGNSLKILRKSPLSPLPLPMRKPSNCSQKDTLEPPAGGVR